MEKNREDTRQQSNLQTMAEFLHFIRETYQDECAVSFRDRGNGDIAVEKTYRDLFMITAQAAMEVNEVYQRNQRSDKRLRVAFMGKVSYDYLAAYLAVVASGNTAILLDCMLPVSDLVYQTTHSDADILFYDKANVEKAEYLVKSLATPMTVASLEELYNLAKKRTDFMDWSDPQTTAHVKPTDVCTILYTSGTTGQSKAVMLTHRNLLAELESVYLTEEIQPEDIMLSVLPIHHIFALAVVNLSTLRCGAMLVIGENITGVLEDMKFFRPTLFCGVPMMFDAIVRKINEGIQQKGKSASVKAAITFLNATRAGIEPRRKAFREIIEQFGGNLRQFYCGGAKVDPKTVRELQALGFIFNIGYGISECAGCIANGRDPEGFIMEMPGIKIRINNGEIEVNGDCVFAGYYKDDDATAEAFTPDGWYRTGDLGTMRADGHFEITGRVKNLIILSNGENVSSEKIEGELSTISGIKELMVFENQGRLAVEIYAENSETVRDTIRKRIAKYNESRPSYLKLIDVLFREDEFEKTTTKKIKRASVTDRVKTKGQDKKTLPMTTIQKQLCEQFGRITGMKDFGLQDHFFLSGGDSIGALEAAAVQYDGFSFSVQELYEHPTVAELAKYITGKKEQNLRRNSIINQRIMEQQRSGGGYVRPRRILLTGANGYLGAHILAELQKREVHICCLIRNPEKLRKSYMYYFNREIPKEIEIVTGYISAKNLGLKEDVYRMLVQKTDAVIHVAAKVKHAGSYDEFEHINVNGTQNIIEFCKEADAVLHHTSTVSVHGSGVTGYDDCKNEDGEELVFTEKVLDIGQKYEDNVYIHSKYEAEEAVILARDSGVRANIYRIGNLTWRFRDGKFQLNAEDNGFMSRIRAIRKLRAVSDEINAFPMDLTPVDECAAAYVALVFNGECGKIYHLYHPELFTAEALLHKLHVRFKHMESWELRSMISEQCKDKDIAVILFYLNMAQQSKTVNVQNRETIKSLTQAGFQWKKINHHYLRYLSGFCR